MKINEAGLAIVKESEGLRLKAYRCPAGVLSVGYGSTGPHVKEGMKITEGEAEAFLRRDLESAEKAVSALCPKWLNENQFSALVSLVFNIGAAAFAGSTLLKELKKSNTLGAACEFQNWVYANRKVLPGLVKRRTAERDLFMRPVIVADNGRAKL